MDRGRLCEKWTPRCPLSYWGGLERQPGGEGGGGEGRGSGEGVVGNELGADTAKKKQKTGGGGGLMALILYFREKVQKESYGLMGRLSGSRTKALRTKKQERREGTLLSQSLDRKET